MQIDLEENEKQFIELKVKKELDATGMRSWKLGMVGEKAVRKTIDETISKLNEKLK